jgi:hypothetical protein
MEHLSSLMREMIAEKTGAAQLVPPTNCSEPP